MRDGEIIDAFLKEQNVDTSLPTLCITECLLIYMKNNDSLSILNWFAKTFTGDLAIANYEMINPND